MRRQICPERPSTGIFIMFLLCEMKDEQQKPFLFNKCVIGFTAIGICLLVQTFEGILPYFVPI